MDIREMTRDEIQDVSAVLQRNRLRLTGTGTVMFWGERICVLIAVERIAPPRTNVATYRVVLEFSSPEGQGLFFRGDVDTQLEASRWLMLTHESVLFQIAWSEQAAHNRFIRFTALPSDSC